MRGNLLDTNIISDAIKPSPSPLLREWMLSQDDERLFISSVNIAEIYRGILGMPAGRRRTTLEAWFAGPLGPRSMFAGRILSFDEDAALAWGALMAESRASGKPRSDIDTFVGDRRGQRLRRRHGQREAFRRSSDDQSDATGDLS